MYKENIQTEKKSFDMTTHHPHDVCRNFGPKILTCHN